MPKRNQKQETKRKTKIPPHASTLTLLLAKVKEDETSEKSIEMPDRKSQPSKCGICKEAFMSRNALFKHLNKKHKFCREWQKQLVEEKTSPRACDGSHTNPCPAASSWQIQRRGHNSSVASKQSNVLVSQTTRLPHVNSFAALYESDDDDAIFSQATTRSTASQFYASAKRLLSIRLLHATLPTTRAPFDSQSWGLLSAIPTRLSTSQLSTTYLYSANTLTLLAYIYDSFDNHIVCNILE